MSRWTIATLVEEEYEGALSLIERVYRADVAASQSAAGQREFLDYIAPHELQQRLDSGAFVCFTAWAPPRELCGVLELRNFHHISLFFVDSRCQRQGIGRALFERAYRFSREQAPLVTHLTVNASPNAVAAYRQFGFECTCPPQDKNGVRFQPMALLVHGSRFAVRGS